MRLLPGGLFYEPDDLGFNNTLIGTSTSVAGNIVPWRSAFAFSRVSFFVDRVSGSGADTRLNMRALDIDGQTGLSPILSLVTLMSIDAVSIFSGNHETPRTTGGTAQVNQLGLAIGPPWVEFTIQNNDAVNTVNITLRALLSP